jgi:hypothetical protein
MGTRLKVDISGLKEYEQQIKQLQAGEMQRFSDKMIRELAAMELAKIIKRTPVGQYPSSSGKNGGTLRQGWQVGQVKHTGNEYEIEISNETYYASYVESGHRTANHKGWVKGQFMVKISEQEMDSQGSAIIEKRLIAFLEGALNGK